MNAHNGRLSALIALFATVALIGGSPAFGWGRNTNCLLVRPHRSGDIAAIAAAHGMTIEDGIGEEGYWLLRCGTRGASETLASLQADSSVEDASPDGVVVIPEITAQLAFAFDAGPTPNGYTNQSALSQVNLGSSHWRATGHGVVVAVIDTGVNANHPDLVGHCTSGYNAIDPCNPPDDLPDGQTGGYGVLDAGAGHGTMVAGVIAVVAPNARIMPIKALAADGSGNESDVIRGILWAVRNGADVINMSFGSPSSSPALRAAVRYAYRSGVVVVASAGNTGDNQPHYPAWLPQVISVASVEENNIKSPYSSYAPSVSLVAPGTGIRSTYWDGGYASWSGTSFAASFVSGAAALVRELEPQGGANRVARYLTRTATSVNAANPEFAGLLGDGLLNIEKAVRRAD